MATKSNRIMYRSVPAGEVIRAELEHRGINLAEFAGQLGLSYSVFRKILAGKLDFTQEIADNIERLTGMPACTTMRMQEKYHWNEVQLAERRAEHWRNLFGWLPTFEFPIRRAAAF